MGKGGPFARWPVELLYKNSRTAALLGRNGGEEKMEQITAKKKKKSWTGPGRSQKKIRRKGRASPHAKGRGGGGFTKEMIRVVNRGGKKA